MSGFDVVVQPGDESGVAGSVGQSFQQRLGDIREQLLGLVEAIDKLGLDIAAYRVGKSSEDGSDVADARHKVVERGVADFLAHIADVNFPRRHSRGPCNRYGSNAVKFGS